MAITMNDTDTSKTTFALTTPLYYVNDLPHIGSAYTTIAADALARFQRLRGKPVLLITGTDEHGQKIERTAEAAGRPPQEYCDEIAAGFEALWQKLDIHYDRFSRTTAKRHEAIVKEFFGRVWDKDDIYLGQQKGWYCVPCEEFKEERDLLEGHRCAIHTNKEAEWRDEQNYFFRLSKYQTQLETLYQEHPDFIQPESRRNEVLSFVERGLQDFSISRVNLDWGFPVPVDPSHTLYVWFDALLGYVTALLEPDAEPTLENALSTWWPINLHLIGKDILRFHAVYWPAMLMSAELPVPGCVFGHGFLTKDGRKMGKSQGNTIDPIALVNRYGSDAVRYYFLKEIEFGQDGDFNETRFINNLNADLANDLGNLLNRTIGMARKYCNACVPNVAGESVPNENPLKAIGLTLGDKVTSAYESLAFSQGCEAILTLVRACNKYIDEQAPWTLYKQGQQEAVGQVLYSVLESVRLAAYLLSPVIPNISNDIYRQLGFELDIKVQQPHKVSSPRVQPAPMGAGSSEVAVKAQTSPTTVNLASPSRTLEPSEPKPPSLDERTVWIKVLQPFLKAPTYLGEFFNDYKGPVVAGAGVLVALVIGNVIVELIEGINDIPLISPALELIGIGYTSWFIYRYAISTAGRQAFYQEFKALREQLVGASSVSPASEAQPLALNTQSSQPPTPDAQETAVAAPYSIHACWGTLPANQPLGEPKPVFQRLEPVESISS